MAVAKKIAYNVVFIAILKALSTALALISIGLITRYLGADGFGDYAVVIAFFSLFGAIADLGLYSITARDISRINANEEKIIGNVFALRLLTSFLVLIISPLLILVLPYSDQLKIGILIGAAAFVFSSSYMVLNGIFQKNIAMHKVALVELIGKAVQVGIVALAVIKDLNFTIIVLSVLFGMITNFLLVLWLARKYTKIKLQFDLGYWKSFLKSSAPMGMSVLITFMYFKLDTILLSVLQNSTAVGMYNAAYKVIENITFFPAMIVGLVLPLMSRYIFSDREKFEIISNQTFRVFMVLVVPVVIGAMFLSDEIIRIIAGEGFSQSADTLKILVFALAFIFFGHFFNYILIAGNLQKKLMGVLFVCAIFNISLNLILIPRLSFTGAAVTSLLTEILVVLLTFFITMKYVRYIPKLEKLGNILLSGLIMGLFLFVFGNTNFIILIIGSPVIYFISLWITKTISKEELLLLMPSNHRGKIS